MPSTTSLGIPYPLQTDVPDTPGYIEALAEKVDLLVTADYVQAAAALSPPGAKLTGGTQVVPNNTATQLVFNAVVFDNAGMADLVSVPTGLILPSSGRWAYGGSITFAPATASYRRAEVTRNGPGTVVETNQVAPVQTAGFPTTVRVQGMGTFTNVGDIFRLQAFQVTGGDLQVLSCSLSMYRFDD